VIWFLLAFLFVCGVDAISGLPEATENYERLEREAYEEVARMVQAMRDEAKR
jgi:hypothetical protein